MDLQKTNLGKVAITVEQDYYDSTKDYDRLVVVEVKDIYKTYISRKPVPSGVNINNREYWIPFSSLSETALIDYNKHLSDLTDELATYIEQIENNTTNINSNDEDIANIQKEQKVQNDNIKNNNTLITTYFRTHSSNNLNTAFDTGFYPKTTIGTPTSGTYNAFVVKASTKDETDNTKSIIQIARCTDSNQINRIYSRLCIFNDENNNHQFTSWEEISNKSVANLVTALEQKVNNVVTAYSKKNKANGLVELNNSGLIPSGLLPSFVDDVLEYNNKAAFPSTGEQGKIYVDKTTNKTYRWSGTTYIQINQLELGETASTAFAGNRGKALEDWKTNKDNTLPERFISNIGTPISSTEGIKIPITNRLKDSLEDSNVNVYLTPATNTENGILSKSDKQLLDNVRYLESISHILDNNAFNKTENNVFLNFKCRNIVNGTPSEYSIPIGAASSTKAGIMTSADKIKLNSLHNYTLPIASKTVLGGVKENSNLDNATIRIEKDGTLDAINLISIDYSTIKNLRNNNALIPGMLYRITDYSCKTTIGISMNHFFDIIVLALSKNRLSEEAYAIQNPNDTYFTSNGCDLTKWKIWYCLDNDTDRFEWADNTNGKGVIYRMIDEYGNEAPYDFKNIKTTHNIAYKDTTNDSWVVEGIKLYTFSYVEKLDDSTQTIVEDVSVTQRYTCRNNKITAFISSIENDYTISTKQTINNIACVINKDLLDYGVDYEPEYWTKGIIYNNELTNCYNCCLGNNIVNNKIHNSSVISYFKTSDCDIRDSIVTLYTSGLYKNIIKYSNISKDSNFNIYEHISNLLTEALYDIFENNNIIDSDIESRIHDLLDSDVQHSNIISFNVDIDRSVIDLLNISYNGASNITMSTVKNTDISKSNDVTNYNIKISCSQVDCTVFKCTIDEYHIDINNSKIINSSITNCNTTNSNISSSNGELNSTNSNSTYNIINCNKINIINESPNDAYITATNVNSDRIFENLIGPINIYVDSNNELIIKKL